ncbi:MAG: hypothetical protein FWF54_03315 [Candidatus Azobacteroides sp.]|nr:hypothetical protein [Candidatus Azobacteroides sp.]
MSTNPNEPKDLLVPKRYDWLWLLIKQNLTTVPGNYTPLSEEDRKDYIRISLLDASGSKVYVRNRSKFKNLLNPHKVYINTMFRSYLTDSGQNEIANHLRRIFKEKLHTFVQGAVYANPKLEQKEAIIMFCEIYKIEFNEISYDMLRKSWDRSNAKKIIRNSKFSFCPILL